MLVEKPSFQNLSHTMIAFRHSFVLLVCLMISACNITESKKLPTLPPAVCHGCRIGQNCDRTLLARLIGQTLNMCKETCWLHPACLSIEYQIGGNSCSLYACLETSTEDGDGYEVVHSREESKKLPTLPPAVCHGCRAGKNCGLTLDFLVGQTLDKCMDMCWKVIECLIIENQIGGNTCRLYACLETTTENGDGYEVVHIRGAPKLTDLPKQMTTVHQMHPSTKHTFDSTTATPVIPQERPSTISNMTTSIGLISTDTSKTKHELPPSTLGMDSTYQKKATTISVILSSLFYTYTKRLIWYQFTTSNTTVETNMKQSLGLATTTRMSEPDRSIARTTSSSTNQDLAKTAPLQNDWTGNPLTIRGTNKLPSSSSVSPSADYFQTSTSETPSVKSTNHSISPGAHGSVNHLSAFFSDPIKAAAVSVVSATIVVLLAVMAAYYRVCRQVKHNCYLARFSRVSPMESGRTSS